MLRIVHHPDYTVTSETAARFPWDKYARLIAFLRQHDRARAEYEPELMPRHWLESIHAPLYVEQVLRSAVPPELERRIGFSITPALARRAQRACGGTWLAAKLALEHGYAANTAGGSHHALRECGAGYCIFNDLAVATHRLLFERDVNQVLIIDLDVHQGDGTVVLLAENPNVVTFSMHAAKNFPSRKVNSSIDVALPDECSDAYYLDQLERHLGTLAQTCRPDLILYQAGVDPHADDKLGRLSLSDRGLTARDGLVASFAIRGGIPLASVPGGGYGDDTSVIAKRHARTIATLAGHFQGSAVDREL